MTAPSIKLCTFEYMLSTMSGLGMAETWLPRVVKEVMLPSTKDGEIKRSPDPVTMIDGDMTWFNNTDDRQAVVVQVERAPRSIVAQSPSTVVIHDAWSYEIGESPSAVYPSVTQDTFGGKCQVDRTSVRAEDLKYGRVFYDGGGSQSWVYLGLVPPGQSFHFRYIASVQTPGVWTKPSEFDARWEAHARWTRLLAFATPYPDVGAAGVPAFPTDIVSYGPAGTYTYFAPGWMTAGDELDVLFLSGGGGGEGDRSDNNDPAGGFAGKWEVNTLVCGTDFVAGTEFTGVIGVGGTGGAWNEAGGDGENSTVSWTDPSSTARVLTAVGGLGGDYDGGDIPATNPMWGQSPGDKLLHTRTYPGGVAVQPAMFQSPGSFPGGGGPAGGWLQYGMPGADGVLWFNARNV